MTDEQRKFAEILQKELDKIFEKHIEDLKNMKVSTEEDSNTVKYGKIDSIREFVVE